MEIFNGENKINIKRIVVGDFLTNCYVLSSDAESAIIDPGGDALKILRIIKKSAINLKYIINTHYHFDHTSCDEILKKETGAKILIHELEKDFVNFNVDKFLKEGDNVKIGNIFLKVVHTPGHSKGSICFLGKNFIFVGDTLFKDGRGRTDLPGGNSSDLKLSLNKISKLFNPEMTIYPGHGEIFIISGKK